ncbi:MAG: PKD domain-containing protein [Bacteroidota bacterium]
MKSFFQKSILLALVGLCFIGCNNDDENETTLVTASFVTVVDNSTGAISFINLSENAEDYLWDFGDGSTSTEVDPTKSYELGGEYMVSLNATGPTGTASIQSVVNALQQIRLPITFEETNIIYDTSTFNGARFSIISNPDQSGSNAKSGNVGRIINSGASFEGIVINQGEPINLKAENILGMNFWSDNPIPVLLKLELGTSADAETVANHSGSGWEFLTFKMNSAARYSRLTLFADGPGTSPDTTYFDDISQFDPNFPVLAASSPTRPAANVISLFSDAYNDVAVDTFRTPWSFGGTLSDIMVDGDAVKQYSDLNFVGIETISTPIDISGMTHIHIDVWSNEYSSFDLKITDYGPDGSPGGGDDDSGTVARSALAQGQWVSLDIPLSQFNLANDDNIAVFELGGEPAGSFTLFIDNLYFYSE